MQLQALMLMLLMVVIIPTTILSSDHNVFFVIISIALLAFSFKNFHYTIFNIYEQTPDNTEERLDDLEGALNIDIKKFGVGTSVARDLIAILFFAYCSYYIHFPWLKVIILLIYTYWLHDIVDVLAGGKYIYSIKRRSSIKKLYLLLVNIGAIVVILFTAYCKFKNILF